MNDPMSPQPHVNNTRFRQAIKRYFYKDIEPIYTLFIKDTIIDGSIEALDTLKELANALNNDSDFAGTVAQALSGKQDTLENQVNIKSINGNSLLGQGDLLVDTYHGLPSTWDINHSMLQLITSINQDTNANPGKSYLGTVYLNDLPENMMLAELIIDIMDLLGSSKVIVFHLSSSDVSPYKWEYTSAYGALGNWRSWLTDASDKEDKLIIQNASGATLTAETGKYYTLSSVDTLAITLPTCTGTKVLNVIFYIETGTTPAVTFTSTHTILYAKDFLLEADSIYEVNALWNGTSWVVAVLEIEVPSNNP